MGEREEREGDELSIVLVAPNLGGYTDAGMPSGAEDNEAKGGRRRVTERLVTSRWMGGNEPR
jgi:hypothetical protein